MKSLISYDCKIILFESWIIDLLIVKIWLFLTFNNQLANFSYLIIVYGLFAV